MARKTKAELAAEREAARAARMLEEAEAYPSRLMAALEEATTKNNYELTVKNSMFKLVDRNNAVYVLDLTVEYTENSYQALESLEYDLEQYAEERAEQNRRYEAKQTALSKLTVEERELLGL